MIRPSTRSLSIASQESYSAVMITDLVADVPVSLETEAKPMKEATNFAYDGHLDGEATGETMDDTTRKTNGAGITKGVILNAIQFQHNDSKTNGDEKPIPLTSALPVPALTQQVSEPKGFKDMSLGRKVAFGFSFIPSILFVLCFAVILPCNVPKPCIEEVWITKFNDTEANSGLEIPANIMFTAQQNGKSVLLELDKNSGKRNEMYISGNSTYLKCGKITNKEKKDCIVMDETGKIYHFNNSYGEDLWNPVSDSDKHFSNPVFLSGCKDGTEDVAFAVSNTLIKVLYSENEVNISDCDTVPFRLTSWKIKDSSDIVFICEKDGEDRLVRIPKNVWCPGKTPEEKHIVLESGAIDLLKQSVFHPLNAGIVLWSGNEVSMIQPNGTYLWKVSNISHPEENRFILYGNFQGENKQVALLSSSLSAGLWRTLLDPSDGSVIKFSSHPNSEVTEMIHIEGKRGDYVLLLLKKTATDTVTTALSQIKDISSTIVNLVSNEEVNHHSTQTTVSEEVALLDIHGNIDSVKVIREALEGAYKSTIAAVSDKDTGVLSIYILSTTENSKGKITEVRNINVANWDKSKKSKCKI